MATPTLNPLTPTPKNEQESNYDPVTLTDPAATLPRVW